MYHYAFYNRYGNGAQDAEDASRIGILHVFASRARRDAWVAADEFDCDWHREMIDSKEAERILRRMARDKLDMRSEDARCMTVSELIASVRDDYRCEDSIRFHEGGEASSNGPIGSR